jgi:ABC-type branched-subunit amino acid transport system ATPase component
VSVPAVQPYAVGTGGEFFMSAERLQCQFGGVRAVADATFGIRRGVITSLIGPNGAGKSTVVGIVGGAVPPSAGRVIFDGTDITPMPPHQRARIGLVRTYQLSSEFARLTVLENLLAAAPGQRGERVRTLLYGKRYWRAQEAELVDRARLLLDRFAMRHKEDEYAGELSGGQKRLLEIMRALMCQPKLLLLDEPMAGVNPALAGTIEGYLAGLAAEGLTMLLVEHELGLVERLSESVIVMSQGKVIATGSMPELRARPEVLHAYLSG